MSRFAGFILLATSLSSTLRSEAWRLENEKLALSIDPKRCSITELLNKLTGERFQVRDQGFSIEVGTGSQIASIGVLTPQNCDLEGADRTSPHQISFLLRHGLVRLKFAYQLDPGDHFAVRTVEATYEGHQPFNVHRLILFDWALEPKPEKAIHYWGGTGWHSLDTGREWVWDPEAQARGRDWVQLPCIQHQRGENSIACFLRSKRGGVFLGISCDFFTMEERGETHRLAYWPGFILPPSRTFQSEKGIVGVYSQKGELKKSGYGVSDLGDFLFPQIAFASLDRGEVEAVSECVKKYVRPSPYQNWVNTWTLGMPWDLTDARAIDEARAAIDTLTALKSTRALPIQPPWLGLYRQFPVSGTNTSLKVSPGVKQILTYMKSKGIRPLGVIHPGTNFPDNRTPGFVDKPEWCVLGADGKRDLRNIALSRQYMDFLWQAMHQLTSEHDLGGWLYDILFFHKDYDTSHGYLPGVASLYPQWRNMLDLNLKLHQVFPDLFLGGWVGWIEHGPWFHQGLAVAHNGHDHFIDLHVNFHSFRPDHMVANNIRLSNYFSRTSRMVPAYVSNTTVGHYKFDIPAWDRLGYQYSLLSNIATSRAPGHLTIIPDERAGETFLPEEREFIDKWLTWAREHEDYYELDTVLFGAPSPEGVDGYAYCKPSDGILFICNSSNTSESVSVRLDDSIRLTDGGPFVIRERYPQDRYRIGPDAGLFARGSSLAVRVPGQTVMVFEIRKYRPGEHLLLGTSGRIDRSDDGIVRLACVTGEAGRDAWLGIAGWAEPIREIYVNGVKTPFSFRRGLALAHLRFDGEALEPELRWKTKRQADQLSLSTDFYLPSGLRRVLDEQRYPLPEKMRSREARKDYPWLDTSRLMVSVPFRHPAALLVEDVFSQADLTFSKAGMSSFPVTKVQPGDWVELKWSEPQTIQSVEIKGVAIKQVTVQKPNAGGWEQVGRAPGNALNILSARFEAPLRTSALRIVIDQSGGRDAGLLSIQALSPRTPVMAQINGRPVPVGVNAMKSRRAGLYVDISEGARYGAMNRLTLTLPGTEENDPLPPRLENVIPVYTDQFVAQDPPSSWSLSGISQGGFADDPPSRTAGGQQRRMKSF